MAKRTTRSATPRTGKGRDTSETFEPNNESVTDRATDVGAPEGTTRRTSRESEPSEDEIRMRAYRRYLERGATDGRDFEDWLEAERELKHGL